MAFYRVLSVILFLSTTAFANRTQLETSNAFHRLFGWINLPVFTTSTTTQATTTTADAFQTSVINLINSFRASFQVNSLTWNATLATTAKACANNHITMSSLTLPACACGTNAAETVGYSYNPAPSQGARGIISTPLVGQNESTTWYGRWIDSCVTFPNPAFNASCADFSQMIWASTTQVGCGYSDGTTILPESTTDGAYFLSCCWSVAGNTPTLFSQNIFEDSV